MHTCISNTTYPINTDLPLAGMTGLQAGCLHVVLTGEGEDALVLTPEAAELARGVSVEGYSPSDCEDGR